MKVYALVKKSLQDYSNPERARNSAWFFKTGKGEYGEGDKFIGVTVPQQRVVAKKYYKEITLPEISKLLKSKIHEERLTAVFMLDYKYLKADEKQRAVIYTFYLQHSTCINNWDLVDSSARIIVGAYLYNKPRAILYTLAKSKNLWERRIAIIATQYFIAKLDFEDTLKISDMLLKDSHDLMHKAVGWMLREVGNKDRKILEDYLRPRYQKMPRTMLRYAIEKFPESMRKAYLRGMI